MLQLVKLKANNNSEFKANHLMKTQASACLFSITIHYSHTVSQTYILRLKLKEWDMSLHFHY